MKTLKYRNKWVGSRTIQLLEEVTFDSENKIEITRYYARTILGLAWPSDKSGAIVAVAEELVNAPGKSGLYVMGIYESTDALELLVKALEFQAMVKFEDAFCNRHNTAMLNFTQQFNHAQHDARAKEINLRQAPFLESDGLISHHLQTLKLLLTTGNKRLYLGEHQRVAAALANISTVALHAIHDYDEPLLAALGFAVAYLQAHRFQTEPPPKKGPYDPWAILKSDYNPL